MQENEINIASTETGDVDALLALGRNLRAEVKEISRQREPIERRWVEDLRQYMGIYPDEVVAGFEEGSSRVFINITKEKTESGEAQLAETIFQEDRNFSISRTPDPELSEALENKEVVVNQDGTPLQFADTKEPYTKGDHAQSLIEQADDAAAKMENEIFDQLVECDYASEGRKAIRSAAILGTGVICGPEVEQREQTAWIKDPQTGKYTNVYKTDKRPIARHVLTWDFFPTMSARTIDECNEVFERSYMSKKTLRDLARIPNIDKESLRVLLEDTDPKSTQTYSEHVSELRRMSGIVSMTDDKRYEVWRYRGPIKKEVLIAANVIKSDAKNIKNEYDGIVIFCGDRVLKAAINPMKTESWPYSVFCWNYDDNCIFGTGIPRAMSEPQAVLNTAMRLMLDNATKSAGPQIVVDGSLIPADGSYLIRPWKFWKKTDPMLKAKEAFETFDFKSYQAEIANIYQLAEAQADKLSGVPAIQQGEQGQVTPTLGGMSMLMNAAGSTRRNQVKHWDDHITVPMIKRFYDWNMQFNEDETIKGDLQVYARGTSSLLLKEQQAQSLFLFVDKYAAHPVVGQFLKSSGLPAMRKAVSAIYLDPDDILVTEDEYSAALEAQKEEQAGQQPQEDPRLAAEKLRGENRMAEIAKEHELRAQENEMDFAIAQMRRDTELAKLSQSERIEYEKLAASARDRDKDRDLKSSIFKTELQVKQVMGEDANFGLDE
jgi:hypothetical protein